MTAAFEGMEDVIRDAMSSMRVYHEVPVLRHIKATWDGGLWVQRHGSDPWDDQGLIDVFGADRQYRGTLALNDPEMPVAFGPGGLAAFWEVDELDVPIMIVKRLPRRMR